MESDLVVRDGAAIDIETFRQTLDGFLRAYADAKPSVSDMALAPMLHSTLRLTRAEAADQAMWAWLATEVCRDYVEARWTSKAGSIADNRWLGGLNKQSLARLWWGAELFRDGPDYSGLPFIHTDMSNSLIHLSWVRCRPLAVSVLPVVNELIPDRTPTKDEIRPWFVAINLLGGGRDLEALGGWFRDDAPAYAAWVRDVSRGSDADAVPVLSGPPQPRVPDVDRGRARELLRHAWRHSRSASE